MTKLQDFIPIRKLGEGSFGTVYQVRRLTDQRIYAMKQVKINQLQQKAKNNALNEVRLLASLNHENIITYYQAFFDYSSQTLCIIMQYADGGDLSAMIKKYSKSFQRIPQSQIWRILILILQGIQALHNKSILHRDLKAQNIFLVGSEVKIGDLNVAKVKKDQLVQTQTGTPYYASPEIWNDIPYNQKSDIWSIGCIIYEMACLKVPFSGNNMEVLYKNIQSGRYAPIPAFYSNQLSKVISKCLQINPKKRSSAEQLLQSEKIIMYKNIFNIGLDKNTKQMNEASNQFLKTIFMPNNKRLLNGRLPESKYQSNGQTNRKSIQITPIHTQKALKAIKQPKQRSSFEKVQKVPQANKIIIQIQSTCQPIIASEANSVQNNIKILQKKQELRSNQSKKSIEAQIQKKENKQDEKHKKKLYPPEQSINIKTNTPNSQNNKLFIQDSPKKDQTIQFLYQFDIRPKNIQIENLYQQPKTVVKKRKSLPRTENSAKKQLQRLSNQSLPLKEKNNYDMHELLVQPLQFKKQLHNIVNNKISAFSCKNPNDFLQQFKLKHRERNKNQNKSRSNHKLSKRKSKQKLNNLNEKIKQSLKNLNTFQKKHKNILDKATQNIQTSIMKKKDLNYYRI